MAIVFGQITRQQAEREHALRLAQDCESARNWSDAARKSIVWCALNMRDFTADDVWDRLEQGYPQFKPPANPAALGNLFTKLQRADVIGLTGSSRPTRRHETRHRTLLVWRKR